MYNKIERNNIMFGLGKKETDEIKKVPEDVNPVEESKEHVCDENCQHEPPRLTRREAKYLKRASYDPNNTKFNTAYVLRNKRTGQIVEIRAASSFHACNIIGWKINRVSLLAQRDLSDITNKSEEVKVEAEIVETASSSNS